MATIAISQAESETDVKDIRRLLREYTSWAFSLAAGAEEAPTFQGLELELAGLPGAYGLPSGRLLLARLDGRAAGCIALIRRSDHLAEVKRLYVCPDCRRHGIGQRLVDTLVAEANVIGYRRLILDSYVKMNAAHAIYERAGFRRVDGPSDFPDEMKPFVVFMERDLSPGG